MFRHTRQLEEEESKENMKNAFPILTIFFSHFHQFIIHLILFFFLLRSSIHLRFNMVILSALYNDDRKAILVSHLIKQSLLVRLFGSVRTTAHY
jgi:hypothetical protein